MYSPIEHKFHTEKDCKREDCNLCACGFAFCTVCEAAEGELLSYCPGQPLTEEAKSDVFFGRVIDLESRRKKRQISQANDY